MDGLKQRVIGALVLISLAVIFVPMLFDEPHTERSSKRIDLPEEPAFPAVDTRPPQTSEPAASTGYRIEEPGKTVSPEVTSDTSEQATDKPAPVSPPPEPDQSTAGSTAPAPAESPAPDPAATESKAEFSGSLKGAWLVQLGSFGNPDNAVRLRNSVQEKGYDSHIQEVVRGDTTLTRVFSGPFAEKTEAERAKKRLDAEFGVNGLVTTGDQ